MIMGAIIKTRRESLGLSQKDFAAMLGVSPGSVWNWENGESNPKIELILPVANALDVDPNFLFGVSEFEADPQARLDALREKFGEPDGLAGIKKQPRGTLPQSQREKVIEMISESLNQMTGKDIDDLSTFCEFLDFRRQLPEE